MARIVTGLVLAVAVLAFAFAGTAQADDSKEFKAYWKNGLNFKTQDDCFKMKIGGRIQLDYWFFDDDNIAAATNNALTWNSGWQFRRARLYMAGSAYKYLMWKFQIDFAGNCPTTDREIEFADVYVGFHNLDNCFGCLAPKIYIGQFKEYFSLEGMTSSNHITFMERALPVLAFSPGRSTGLGFFHSFLGDRMTLGYGIWGHNVNDCGDGFWRANGAQGGYDISGRLTGLLWAPCGCDSSYLHLGAYASYQADFNTVGWAARPEINLSPVIAATGLLASDDALVWGAEMAFNYNSFHLQGEYIAANVSAPVLGDPAFFGYYVEGSWMFGGFRPFRRDYATMGAVKPCNNWLDMNCCGAGAWEIAARYSFLDLTDGNVVGGEVSNITVGLNWYMNPNAVIKLNYVLSNLVRPGVDESLNAFGIRFQVYF